MIMHGSVIRTKFQVCKLQLKHEINMTNLRVKLRLGSKSPSSESSPTSLPSSVISIERLRIKNNCLLQCMCIISKQILLYGSDVQLYNEKAFQNNIKSLYIYPAHIYTTQYKETKLHQSSRKKFGAPDVRQFCPSLVSFP